LLKQVDNPAMTRCLVLMLASACASCAAADAPVTTTVVDLPEATQAQAIIRLTLAGSTWTVSGAKLDAASSEDGAVLHGLEAPINVVSWPASAAFVQRLEEHLATPAGAPRPEIVHQADHGENGFEAVVHVGSAWEITVLKRRADYMDGAMCSCTANGIATYKAALAVCASLKPSQLAGH